MRKGTLQYWGVFAPVLTIHGERIVGVPESNEFPVTAVILVQRIIGYATYKYHLESQFHSARAQRADGRIGREGWPCFLPK